MSGRGFSVAVVLLVACGGDEGRSNAATGLTTLGTSATQGTSSAWSGT